MNRIITNAQATEMTPVAKVEDMLRDIALVVWLTRKVSNEILTGSPDEQPTKTRKGRANRELVAVS